MTQQTIKEYLVKAGADIRLAQEKLYDGGNASLIHVLRAKTWIEEVETELMKRI